MATVSVVVPTYNGRAFVAEALASVFRQTVLPDEVIVVDDASTDGTPAIVEGRAASAPVPLRLMLRPANSGGPAGPMNQGVEAARGELIAVLDQDDVLLPRKLEEQARVLERNADVSLVFSLFGLIGQPDEARELEARRAMESKLPGGRCTEDGRILDGREALGGLLREGMLPGGFPGFMFRRSDWEAKGGFDESLVACADYEFACWLCTRGTVAWLPRIHYRHRRHAGNLSRQGLLQRLEVVEVLRRHLEGLPAETGQAVRARIRYECFRIARRLTAGRCWSSALAVASARPRLPQHRWSDMVQIMALPLYPVAQWFARRPTPFDRAHARRAEELATSLKTIRPPPG